MPPLKLCLVANPIQHRQVYLPVKYFFKEKAGLVVQSIKRSSRTHVVVFKTKRDDAMLFLQSDIYY